MRRKIFDWALPCLFFVSLTALPAGASAPSGLVGTGLPTFSLLASDGRLVDYRAEYYGRHHLILTFYPAAFTPV